MPKQKTPQRQVLKIHSAKIRKAKGKLTIDMLEARKSEEVVALGDSQLLRFIDEARGNKKNDERAMSIKGRMKELMHNPVGNYWRTMLRDLRAQYNEFVSRIDYVLVIMDTKNDFKSLCESGFTLNGRAYTFLFGTTGGVKTSTMIFVDAELYPVLIEKVNNGRDMSKPFIPAKLEAYMSLVCSASVPVSDPKGVLVVDDCITHFKENVISIKDGDGAEPILEYVNDYDIEYADSDGYGLMSPELSERWGLELGEEGAVSGNNIRNSFTKGMLFTFDFKRFAREVAHKETVTDVWGNEVNVNDVDIIMTTSMLKLWDSYKSWDDYWTNCKKNGYTFAVTKVCPHELENERTTNYQNLQPYDWSDAQVEKFIERTCKNIRESLCGEWGATILYVKGGALTERKAQESIADWTKALMISPEMMKDTYIRGKIRGMIQRRIDDAKIGVIDIEGNYSIISGDPFSLCQSVFGLEVTGLLKAGECYHRHWADKKVKRIAMYRAPMSCPNNIRVMNVADTEAERDWYRYMTTCTILNSWDSTCAALNGADKDSDAVLTTNDELLISTAPNVPTIMCEQKKGEKKLVETVDMITSNILAAGDDIGAITNRITAMYDKMTLATSDAQKEALTYRIQCGQHAQQNAID